MPAPGTKERSKRIAQFLSGLRWKEGVMRLGLKKSDPLNRKVDTLRRELLATTQVEFFKDKRFAEYGGSVESILYIGSAGRKNNKAYKYTDSDIDFTILVKDDMSKSKRAKLRDDFMLFLQERAGVDMESLDMSVMVDPVPRFFKTGESIPDLLAAAVDPVRRAQLKAGILDSIAQLVVNASDGERYLDRGNLFRHNLFIRLGGFLKRPESRVEDGGVELVEEPMSRYDELYGDVPLEPWMAFDAVVGNMGYVHSHCKNKNDVEVYQKNLAGKYAIRGPLYALVIGSPAGRKRLKSLTREEVEAKGWEGAERILVDVAKELLAKPDGMKELGLPTTILEAGQNKPTGMGKKEWSRLFEEWILRKEGHPLEEVFGKPRGLKLETDHKRFDLLMTQNIARSEAVFTAALRKSIMDQAIAIKQLESAAKQLRADGDAAGAELLDLKVKEIFMSQLAVWNRMGRDDQLLVMKEMPPEADWWVAIEASERLKTTGGATDPSALRAWRPGGGDPAQLRARVEQYRTQVLQEEPASPMLRALLVDAQWPVSVPPDTLPAPAAAAPTDPKPESSPGGLQSGLDLGGALKDPPATGPPPPSGGIGSGAKDVLRPPP